MTTETVIDIHRQGLRLQGTPHDISRVLEACKRAMQTIERDRYPLDRRVAVVVEPPQDDEP